MHQKGYVISKDAAREAFDVSMAMIDIYVPMQEAAKAATSQIETLLVFSVIFGKSSKNLFRPTIPQINNRIIEEIVM